MFNHAILLSWIMDGQNVLEDIKKKLVYGDVLMVLKHMVSLKSVSRTWLGITAVILHLVFDISYTTLNKCLARSLIVGCTTGPQFSCKIVWC